MKKLFLVLCLFVSNFLIAQELPKDSVTGKYTFQGIVKVDSVSKNELYSRAREWISKSFVSANNVIQMDDKELGKIIGKGKTQNYYFGIGSDMGSILFTISIQVKDNKFKYTITDFIHTWEGTEFTKNRNRNLEDNEMRSFTLTKGAWSKLKLKLCDTITSLEKDLIKNMTIKTNKKSEDF